MSNYSTPGGTELPMINLKGKNYLMVAHRLVWFREEHPDWGIVTKVDVDFQNKRSIGSAQIIDDKGKIIATAHKVEDSEGFGDYIEKSETGAIGRALALCGYGTQFAPELDEGERLVDSPIKPKQVPQGREAVGTSRSPHVDSKAPTLVQPSPIDSKPYIATIGKHKGKILTILSPEELKAHQEEILQWLSTNKNMTAQNKKLAEELMTEIDRVL